MMDLRILAETAAAARRQVETRRHQDEWMWSAILTIVMMILMMTRRQVETRRH